MAANVAEQLNGDFARFMTCDVDQSSPDEAAQLVLAAEVIDRSFQAKRREVVALFERQGAWQADGATSAANWPAARSGGEARSCAGRSVSPRAWRPRRRWPRSLRSCRVSICSCWCRVVPSAR